MSNQNSYETLGLTDAASFEEVQSARQRLIDELGENPQRKEQIEAAYDAILMDRLRLRQEGKIKVPDRIRFAEKQAEAAAKAEAASRPAQPPDWLQDWLDTPSRDDILWPSVIYLGLSLLCWFTAADAASADAASSSVALGFGVAVCIYFLNRKERRFWRAILLSTGTLLLGLLLGFAVLSLIGQQGADIELAQQSAIAAIVTLLLFWFVSCFLR
ncbi:MAG: CPP1-like family protein [Cyanobacteria bacterium P01_A01_bin.105]